MRSDNMRQLDFYPGGNHSALVIGAGAIGSYVAFGLKRMGVKKVTVVDFDTVAGINLPNQFFSESLTSDVDDGTLLKTIALQSTLDMMMPGNGIEIFSMKMEEYLEIARDSNKHFNAVFPLVDDMNVRKYLFDFMQNRALLANYLIDSRVGGQYAHVYSIDMNNDEDVQYYKDSLWSNEESQRLPCTGTAVIDVSFCVAGECIGRFRQAMLGKLQVLDTFHDYSVGSSCIFQAKKPRKPIADVVRNNDFVANVGMQSSEVADVQQNTD